jgi:hypothetical protein
MGVEKDKEAVRRERQRKSKPSGKGFGDYKFIDINLTEEEKEIFRMEHFDAKLNTMTLIEDWVSAGYKLSISTDDKGGGVLVTLTARFGSAGNEGLILTARAGDAHKALQVLWYKDFFVCGDGGWALASGERSGLGGDIG